jgi:hypothetical protein
MAAAGYDGISSARGGVCSERSVVDDGDQRRARCCRGGPFSNVVE